MDGIAKQIIDKLAPTGFYVMFAILLILLLLILAFFFHAYRTGRKFKIGPIEIDGNGSVPDQPITPPSSGSVPVKLAGNGKRKRIMLLCGTTTEIESSPVQSQVLLIFYKALVKEIERTPYCINTCGSQPLRQAITENYCEKLYSWSRQQIDELQDKVRWYFFRTDSVGLNYEPAFYKAIEASGLQERTLMECADSDIIIAFTGRMGLREQVERLLKYHSEGLHGIDLNRKPLIVLGWFGGSAMQLLLESPYDLGGLEKTYSDLNPYERIQDFRGDNAPEALATRLVARIRKTLA